MSLKSKDLQYDNAQPAFLRRLRGELQGDDSGRHETPIPRNKRPKQDDDEDAPTYVMEDTNCSLTKAEYDAMVAGKGAEDDAATQESDKPQGTAIEDSKKDNIAEVGKATKKRKIAKVIGKENDKSAKKDDGEDKEPAKKVVKKGKRKAKPVKLSFGDEEG